MISMNCQLDFDPDFWSGFDTAMMEEWNIAVTTSCHEVEDHYPSNLYAYKSLASRLLLADATTTTSNSTTAIAEQATNDFTIYINSILGEGQFDVRGEEKQVVFLTEYSDRVFLKPTASGVAYPTENLAFVKNNFEYSTAATSHEILHLVLEAEGYEKSCYADAVHENQFKYELEDMGGNKYPVMKKFDC
jgi:hypothetical protein